MRFCFYSQGHYMYFSEDGHTWHASAVAPFGNTVALEGNSTQLFSTLERPKLIVDNRGKPSPWGYPSLLSLCSLGCSTRERCGTGEGTSRMKHHRPLDRQPNAPQQRRMLIAIVPWPLRQLQVRLCHLHERFSTGHVGGPVNEKDSTIAFLQHRMCSCSRLHG